MSIRYDKLVRDRIPEIVRKAEKTPFTGAGTWNHRGAM